MPQTRHPQLLQTPLSLGKEFQILSFSPSMDESAKVLQFGQRKHLQTLPSTQNQIFSLFFSLSRQEYRRPVAKSPNGKEEQKGRRKIILKVKREMQQQYQIHVLHWPSPQRRMLHLDKKIQLSGLHPWKKN